MSKKSLRLLLIIFICVLLLVGVYIFLSNADLDILNPQGEVAQKQKDLIVFATVLSATVVVPVFALTLFIAMKYKETNKKAKYTPNWDGNKLLESIWWGIPIALILVLSVVTYKSSHDLDPFKPLESEKKAMTVQVIALEWKWLFIYPEQNIATVNYLQIPEDTPVKFEITADAPMNSFWIPKLGGQIYAMSGMTTNLNLIANDQGEYDGVSANISGEGFAGMKFKVKSTSDSEFQKWVNSTKQSDKLLTKPAYQELAEPSANVQPMFFSNVDAGLYNTVMVRYMDPGKYGEHTH